jgi:hypothetical protein
VSPSCRTPRNRRLSGDQPGLLTLWYRDREVVSPRSALQQRYPRRPLSCRAVLSLFCGRRSLSLAARSRRKLLRLCSENLADRLKTPHDALRTERRDGRRPERVESEPEFGFRIGTATRRHPPRLRRRVTAVVAICSEPPRSKCLQPIRKATRPAKTRKQTQERTTQQTRG